MIIVTIIISIIMTIIMIIIVISITIIINTTILIKLGLRTSITESNLDRVPKNWATCLGTRFLVILLRCLESQISGYS